MSSQIALVPEAPIVRGDRLIPYGGRVGHTIYAVHDAYLVASCGFKLPVTRNRRAQDADPWCKACRRIADRSEVNATP